MSDVQERIAGLSSAKRALLERLRVAAVRAPEGVPRRGGGPAPLSWEQRRLWFLHRLAPEGGVYTIPAALRLTGPLDGEALRAALHGVVQRHQALRLVFHEVDGEPVQEAGPADRVPVGAVDLRARPGEAGAVLAEFFGRGFDLLAEPPFRALLLRTAGDEHVLALATHHVAGDGASTALLLRETAALYTAGVEGRQADLPEPPLQFPDFAAWQRAEPVDAAALDGWRRALDGAPQVLQVPPDRPRPAMQSFAGSGIAFALGPGLSGQVRALAAGEHAGVFAVLVAALAVVLSRATGEDDLLIGTAVANRAAQGAEGAAGFFVNTLPLRMRVDEDDSARTLIARAGRRVAQAHDRASVPFDRIVDAVRVRRDPGRPPLVQVMVSMDPDGEDAPVFPGISATRLPVDTGAAPFDLTVSVADARDGIRGELRYPTALYDAETVQRLADRFAAALAAFVARPAAPVAALALVGDDERRTLDAWGRGAPARADGCVHHLFQAQARATPHALAVAWADQEVSYAALERRANRIAHHLAGMGVGPESRVGVLMERTPALVAALLGVLKAGAAYVPLDPRNPPARLAEMVRASGARALLVDGAHAGRLADAAVPEVAVHRLAARPGATDAPAVRTDPRNLAYVMFTSGSTGGPKGVEVTHGSVFALMHTVRALLSPAERAAWLACTPLGFDVSVLDVFAPLSWGGTVVLVDGPLADPPAGHLPRTAFLVPSVAAERIAAGDLPAGVRALLVGGEALAPALARELHARRPGLRLINVYGPTEATVFATFAQVPPGAEHVGIGGPVDGGRAYVLDRGMRSCGIGEPGELWLAGSTLARGYAGRPGLTAERFVPDPLGPPGSRMYRTLDRARVRRDGTFDYLGRADLQVKVHGVRIEPGEVEAALREHPAVREAAVDVRVHGGHAALAAWVVAEDGHPPPAAHALRGWLRERLPEAMVPSLVVPVGALPRTAAGKLDRRALAAPVQPAAHDAYAAPRTPAETAVAAVWGELLGVARVGVHDDFFALGGNSLVALRVVARVREATGVAVPVATLLQGPTVEQMARAVVGRRPAVRLPVVALQPEGAARPLFLVHAGGGHVACYAPLASLLAPDQPLYAFQARGLDDGLPPLQGVEAMAAYYVEGLRRAQPRGPYRLGGWSYGGIAAYEMARQLAAAGDQVELLALLDTGRPESRGDARFPLDHAGVLRRILTDLYGWGSTAGVTVEALRRLDPDAQLRFAARTLGKGLLPESRLPEVAALTRVRMANHNAMVDWVARPYPGRLTYLQTRGSASLSTAQEPLRFWGRLADGGFGVHQVAGHHGTLLQKPHVDSVAAALRRVVAELDGAP